MIEKKLTVIIPVYNNGELTRRVCKYTPHCPAS